MNTLERKMNGVEETESDHRSRNANGMREIVPLTPKSNGSDGLLESQIVDSIPLSEVLKKGISDSMIYADNAMNELDECMSGLFANQPDDKVVTRNPERVQIAVNCAQGIAALIKVKNETLKLLGKK